VKSEDEFTKPRPDWTNPGYWTAPDAYSTECEVTELVAAFVRALQPEYVVETGTAFGYTAAAIGAALAANGHGRLDTIEIDEEKVTLASDRCKGLPVTVVDHLVSSNDIRALFLNTPRGVCFAEVL
jgi:predicted O-methyltransferase YrrM